jgi:nucleoside-diphosphate-sugar epimerase
MDVLMIGGTRFFGKRIVEQLLEAGHKVTLYTRGNSRPPFWERVNHILGDRTDHADFKRKLEGRSFDVVVDNFGYAAGDVAAALECPAVHNCRHYIFTSSAIIYLSGSLTMPLVEDDVDFDVDGFDPASKRFMGRLSQIARTMGDYALEKLRSERLLFDQEEVPFTIFRPPVVIGPGDHHQRGYFYIQRILDGGPLLLSNGAVHPLQNIYRDDVARAYMLAIEGEARQHAYNIAGREILPARRWFELAAQALSKPAEFVSVGDELLQQGLPGYLEPWEFGFTLLLDTCRVKHEFGFHSTPLEDWWPDTVRWYCDQDDLSPSKGYDRREQEIEFARRLHETARRLGH